MARGNNIVDSEKGGTHLVIKLFEELIVIDLGIFEEWIISFDDIKIIIRLSLRAFLYVVSPVIVRRGIVYNRVWAL